MPYVAAARPAAAAMNQPMPATVAWKRAPRSRACHAGVSIHAPPTSGPFDPEDFPNDCGAHGSKDARGGVTAGHPG